LIFFNTAHSRSSVCELQGTLETLTMHIHSLIKKLHVHSYLWTHAQTLPLETSLKTRSVILKIVALFR
jgi:hypothetical protein